MIQVLLIVHLLIALVIIALVLMQQGKGAETGASFGAGASQTIFGSAGSWNFFSRMTAIFAALFFVSSISLAVLAKRNAEVGDPHLPAIEKTQQKIPEGEGEIPLGDRDSGAEIPKLPNAGEGNAIPGSVPGSDQGQATDDSGESSKREEKTPGN